MMPNRVKPLLPAGSMKTYQILAPRATHLRDATCDEVDCPNYLIGWKTVVDERTDLGAQQAYYIRNQSGRHFKEDRNESPGLTTFYFEAGQICFARHEVKVGKPELYIVKGGDWRGNPAGIEPRKHANPADWVDDFANHQDKLATELSKG